jgi:hypothetical protein
MIKVVTITGADESVTAGQLFDLSRKFPFVEWAILVSRNSTGTRTRFPAISWINKLIDVAKTTKHSDAPMKLSLHLCGDYVNEILNGDIDFVHRDLTPIWPAFNRVQINTHGVAHDFDGKKLVELLSVFPEKEFIFQYDNMNDGALNACIAARANCSALFDMSHGAGIAPKHWPDLLPGVKCGYAGGISPQNIGYHISKINDIIGGKETWIDMETHVRSNNDKQFDLHKVTECLNKYVESMLAKHDY